MITLAAIPLKNCRQCSHYRGGFCYGFGTAKQVFSESEAILCGTYTPLGQVQIGPIDSLGGQLAEYQLPSGIISTIKLADAAVTLAKLSASSVNDSKVAAGAGIIESKLNLDFETAVLNALIATNIADIATNVTGISTNVIDIASNLALILLREETANKDQVNGYLGLDAGAKVPLAKLNPLTNSEIAVAAAIAESKLNLAFGTSALNTDIQTREESSNKGAVSGYCGLDVSQLVPLANLSNLTNTQIAVAAAIIESKLNLDFGTSALNTDIQTREESSNKGAISGYCGLDVSQLVPLANLSNLSNTQIAAAAAIAENKLNLAHSTSSLNTAILLRELAANKDVANGYLGLDAGAKVPLAKLNPLTNTQIAVAAAIAENKLNLAYGTSALNTAILLRELASNKGIANGYCDLDAAIHVPLNRLSNLSNAQIAAAAAIAESKLNLNYPTHPQAHTLASHSSKAHSELTGVTADQHHAQAHTLASHSSKAHSELTGVTADQHHAQSHNIANHSDVTVTGAHLEALLMYGLANIAYVPCAQIVRPVDAIQHGTTWITCLYAGTEWAVFLCPMPTNKGSIPLKLHVRNVRIEVITTDVNDYIDEIWIRGINLATPTTVYTYVNTDRFGNTTYVTTNTTPDDMSSYTHVLVVLKMNASTVGQLSFGVPQLQCYYDT